MTFTLTNARDQVKAYTDDDETRFSTTAIDRALDGALSLTLRDMAQQGATQLLTKVQTASTDGVLDLSTYDPLSIFGVAIQYGSSWEQLNEAAYSARRRAYTEDATLSVIMQRRLSVPSTTSHPLIGVGAAAANATAELDRLVCVRAAQELIATDNEQSAALEALERKYWAAVMSGIGPGKGRDFPRPGAWWSDLRWVWDPSTRYLSLWFVG
jgi:hypothetical protein